MILRQLPHAALLLFSLLSASLSLPVRLEAAPRAEVVDEEDAESPAPSPASTPAQRPVPAPLLPGPPVPNPSPASTAFPLKVSKETPVAMMVPLPPDSELDTLLRMQIFLDEHNFGPGKLDGRMGEFGKKAASVYNQIHNIPVGDYGPLIAASGKANANIYTTYQVKDGDLAFVTPKLPGKPSEQAKTKYLGYRSLLEFVSERFHTSEEFLVKINPGRNLNILKPGSVLKVPNVKPFELENWAKHVQFKAEQPGSGHAVVVDIRARVAIFFDDKNKPIASFPVTPGEPRFIKFGEWKVTNMVSTPTFRWDKSMLEEGKRSSSYYELPLGPNNPVGVMWCGTSRSGIGLHGTNNPLTIGRAESHGCIRMANWDAVRLPGLLRPGARVIIR